MSNVLSPGTVLADTYELVRPIAQGGMGIVYEGKHLRLNKRRVAIKVLRTENLGLNQKELVQRFRREAEICAELTHPHIVSVTDWNTLDDDAPYFVMEYLQGESLHDRMERGCPPDSETKQIIRQVGLALSAAHALSIIHRDLKPSNIFLVRTSGDEDTAVTFAKVLDFGISKVLNTTTLETTEMKILGSPKYMSPEQARARNNEINARSDQFSFASVSYELFTGQAPFDANSFDVQLYNIVHEDPIPLEELRPDLPPHVGAAIAKAMAKSPKERFASVDDFVQAVLDEKSEPAQQVLKEPRTKRRITPTGPMEPISWRTPRRPGLINRLVRNQLVITAVLLCILAALAVELYFGGGADDSEPPPPATTGTTDQEEQEPPESPLDNPETAELPKDISPPTKAPSKTRPPQNTVNPTPAKPLSPEAKEKLTAAREAFDAKSFPTAIRLAQQSILAQDSAQARTLIFLSHCAQGDLSNARATLHKVSGTEKQRALKRCSTLGLEL